MGWHLLETLLQQVGEHSTLVGKLWVTATFVFRFIIVASVGDAVYSDEQSDFNCNTGQEGELMYYILFSLNNLRGYLNLAPINSSLLRVLAPCGGTHNFGESISLHFC